ncbi:MAG: response regulator transcription factor [Victivallales bacterium]|nr:response regulator transcription factor [Victivallales bacterium]
MKVLIVEDDASTAEFIQKGFKQAGYTVTNAYSGPEGLFKVRNEGYDLAIIDVMLPGMSGFDVIKTLRQEHIMLPIIILSARAEEENKIKGLECGADDYQTKPFSLTELLARANAQIRRASAVSEPVELQIADLKIDLVTRKVFRGDTRIILQPLEFQLLEFLMRNKGRVVSRTTIMEHVWEYNFDPHTNVVDSRICHLRDKIDKNYEPKLLKTIRGFGYVLEES